jgi:catechol 2,3-dioxygenase-like lactoylglutathione lyase family enzyme
MDDGAMTDTDITHLRALAEAGRQARVVPTLRASDLARTADFYRNLGFTVESFDLDAEPPHTNVGRDGIYLFYFAGPDYGAPPGTPSPTPTLSGSIYIFPDNVDALAEEWCGKVPFVWGPATTHYGMYEFGINDPDGYHLAFAERRYVPR